jgi:tRNA modification GTPase
MTDDLDPSGGCRFRVLTAPGPGAVAVIELVCGTPKTAEWILRRISSSSGQTPGMSIGRICYGRWNDEDLVVVRTSVRMWEIQCHGGTVAVNRIRGDLLNDGATEDVRRLVGCGPALGSVPGAETEHLGKIGDESGRVSSESVRSMVQQAVQSRLAHARSRRTAGLLLAQASSSLCCDLMIILDSQHRMTAEATAVRQRLTAWQDVADHLTEPWRVVFAGAPNVGKSSLMNVIAGMERSIVCDQPGTTRDVVEVDGVVAGWPFRFVDTAGLRKDSADQIEELGVEQSCLAASQCDVLCLVFDDLSNTATWSDRLWLAKLPKHTVLVRNKCDLITRHDFDQAPFRDSPTLSGLPVINVSARTGQGVPELLQWIKQSVVPHEPAKDTALPICGL